MKNDFKKIKNVPFKRNKENWNNFLNEYNQCFSKIDKVNAEKNKVEKEKINVKKNLVEQLKNNLQLSISTQIIIHGVSEILRQPEFSQLKQIKKLIRLLEEEQDKLHSLILDFPESKIYFLIYCIIENYYFFWNRRILSCFKSS